MISVNYNIRAVEPDSTELEDRAQDAQIKRDCWKVSKIFLELLAIGGICVMIPLIGFHSWTLLPLIGLNLYFLVDGLPYFLGKLPTAAIQAIGNMDPKEKDKVERRASKAVSSSKESSDFSVQPQLLPQQKASNNRVQSQAVQRKPWRPAVLGKKSTPPKTAKEIWGEPEVPSKELPFKLPISPSPTLPETGKRIRSLHSPRQPENWAVDSSALRPFDKQWNKVCDAILNDPSVPQCSA